ncbi:MAG: LacI family DNA-binding transcriptional regulator [Anaerolineae bacterium]
MAEHTVYDVARKAGVSIATVSRVLNNPDKVSPGTRERILKAVDELGFVPKAEAAARARRASRRIGVLAPFFTYPSFVQRLRGVATALAGRNYELVIYNVDTSARRDAYLTSLAVTRRLDGLIIMALPFDAPVARRLSGHAMESVLIEFSHPHFSSIEIDNHQGGRLAAEYLLSRGHRRCGFVGDTDLPTYAIHTSDWRLAGYREALAQASVNLPDSFISLAPAPHGIDMAHDAALRLLNLDERPTAIFAASDTQALGVLKAARERGVRVPEDLAVLGFDDIDISDYIGLTTIRQQLEESGRVAVELLLARLADDSRSVQHIRLPLELIQRQTA